MYRLYIEPVRPSRVNVELGVVYINSFLMDEEA